MNGRKSKAIRRKVYGPEGSPRQRVYEFKVSKIIKLKVTDPKDPKNPEKMKEKTYQRMTLTAGPTRALYQQEKKRYKGGRLQLS